MDHIEDAREKLLHIIGAVGDCPGCRCSFCADDPDADSYRCADCGRMHSNHEFREHVDALIAAVRAESFGRLPRLDAVPKVKRSPHDPEA